MSSYYPRTLSILSASVGYFSAIALLIRLNNAPKTALQSSVFRAQPPRTQAFLAARRYILVHSQILLHLRCNCTLHCTSRAYATIHVAGLSCARVRDLGLICSAARRERVSDCVERCLVVVVVVMVACCFAAAFGF